MSRQTVTARTAPVPDDTSAPSLGSLWRWPLTVTVVGAVTLGLHLFNVTRSYDLFIDEPFYTQLGQSVSRGSLPYATGQFFFLHPPGFFPVEAIWMHLVGYHDDVFASVFSIRALESWFSGATAVLLCTIVARLTSRRVGLAAAAAYAINTFINRETAFVLLETPTLFWALSGYAILLRLPGVGERRRPRREVLARYVPAYRPRRPLPADRATHRDVRVVAVGVCFGLCVLTKEFGFFVTVVPMGLCILRPSVISRAEAAIVLVLSGVPYLLWISIAAGTGHWAEFETQLTAGFSRSAGTTQISGFNRPGAPSFVHTLIASLVLFATAYFYLATAALGSMYLSWKATGYERLVGYSAVGVLPLLAYSVTAGANEEQFYNFLIVPGFVVTSVVAWRFRHLLRHSAVALVAALVVTAVVASDATNYVVLRSRSDDATYQVDRWMRAHVPDGTVVAVTNPVQREIFLRYTMVDDDPGVTLGPEVQYLVVFQKQVDLGYAFPDPVQVAEQVQSMRLVFQSYSTGNGLTLVYTTTPEAS